MQQKIVYCLCGQPFRTTQRNCKAQPVAHHQSWGFSYKTLGFSWIKTNKKNKKPFFGIGFYTKSNCEVCLLAIKGKPSNLKKSNYVSSCVISDREEHSKKPDEVRIRINELVGDVPKIELFARKKIEGWDCWGDEV